MNRIESNYSSGDPFLLYDGVAVDARKVLENISFTSVLFERIKY